MTDQDRTEPYENSFLKGLFNQMASAYEHVGDIVSFGLNRIWRKRAVDLLDLKAGDKVYDLMSGTGEAWRYILPRIGEAGSLHAVDFSHEMSVLAAKRKNKLGARNVQVVEGDALATAAPAESVDAVYSAYGVKTLSPGLYRDFAAEVKRVLKPGGKASIMEVALPENRLQRALFTGYINAGFYVMKKVLGPKAGNFSLFKDYLLRFGNSKGLQDEFQRQGFKVRYVRLPADGATAIVAQKPFAPKA